MSYHVLIVDDEKNIRRTLEMVLTGEGYRVTAVATAEEGLELLEREEIDLAILDVKLPGISGIDALKRIRERRQGEPQLPVLMISAHATVKRAVEAVQLGAADFFEKPIERDRVVISIRNSLEKWRLVREVTQLRARVEPQLEMIGSSEAMKRLFEEIRKVAPTKGRVLITGESGTGKELIARAVHRLSSRADAPFVKVNCAAIPGELIESELFGYERGAFTGAQGRKRGQFELADGGTLFLDEVGELELALQPKLLKFLESHTFRRVGGLRDLSADVRVIAATNVDLAAQVKCGRFREDLYYRLKVMPVRLLPLCERRADIEPLVRHFVAEGNRARRRHVAKVSDESMQKLCAYDWPGNIRELRNVIERAMILVRGDTITPWGMTAEILGVRGCDIGPLPSLAAMERRLVAQTLAACQGNRTRTAKSLGISRSTLLEKLRRFQL